MTGKWFKLGYDRFLPHSSYFSMHYHQFIGLSATENTVKCAAYETIQHVCLNTLKTKEEERERVKRNLESERH
jgi:hypothetical protein